MSVSNRIRSCVSSYVAFPRAKSYESVHQFVTFPPILKKNKVRILDYFLFMFQMFTNSDKKHVKRVLERLGIEEECFDRIVCFETLNPQLFDKKEETSTLPRPPVTPEVILKPSIAAVETAIRLAGSDARRTVWSPNASASLSYFSFYFSLLFTIVIAVPFQLFLDDSERNVAAGKAVGLCTALVIKQPPHVYLFDKILIAKPLYCQCQLIQLIKFFEFTDYPQHWNSIHAISLSSKLLTMLLLK